jgi:putative iron-only hydrogenase system regulator
MLMEKRIGASLILVEDKSSVAKLNEILSRHADIIIARQGIPLLQKGVSVISLVLEGTSDQIGALTGPIGKLPGVQVKSLLMKSTHVVANQ